MLTFRLQLAHGKASFERARITQEGQLYTTNELVPSASAVKKVAKPRHGSYTSSV